MMVQLRDIDIGNGKRIVTTIGQYYKYKQILLHQFSTTPATQRKQQPELKNVQATKYTDV